MQTHADAAICSQMLEEFTQGLANRARGTGEMSNPQLVKLARELGQRYARPIRDTLEEPAPWRVATAMGLAIFSQPHLTITFRRQTEGEDEDEEPLVVPNEVLERALGLAAWELDDLREEVDRRVGLVLTQARALHWLWGRFGLPNASPDNLFRVLIPGAPNTLGPVGLIRRGSQLYIVVSQSSMSQRSLYLGWLDVDAGELSPLNTFGGKYVDLGLRRRLGRSVGGTPEEMASLLDAMVTIVPRNRCDEFLIHDEWRSRGCATMTNLAHPYGSGRFLSGPLQPGDLPWRDWLAVEGLTKPPPMEVFDGLMLPRSQQMMRQLYAEMLAGLANEPKEPKDGRSDASDLDLYQLAGHLSAIGTPLLEWGTSPKTFRSIAGDLGGDEERARLFLQELEESWTRRLERRWAAPASTNRPHTVQSLLTNHLLASHVSLRRLYRRQSDPRFRHQDVLRLFAAFYYSEAPLERLWDPTLSVMPDEGGKVPLPEDVIGEYFWPLWLNVLNNLDNDGMQLPDGIPDTFYK